MRKSILLSTIIFMFNTVSVNATADQYLILQNIDHYKYITQTLHPLTKRLVSKPGYIVTNDSGILSGTDHFAEDHTDTNHETYYESDIADLGVEVQVTQHTGGDSDQWLFHEIEDGYRDGDDSDNLLGRLSGQGVKIRIIDGNPVIYWGLGGGAIFVARR